MEEKKVSEQKENNSGYTVLIVPKNKRRVLEFSISYAVVVLVPVAIAVFILLWALSGASDAAKIDKLQLENSRLLGEADAAKAENILLQADIEELNELITKTTTQVEEIKAADAQNAEEQTKKFIPDSFPVAGAVGIPTEYSDQNPYRQFTMAEYTRVIATANGSVKSVEQKDEQYVIEVDHGNGYISRYTCKGVVCVNQGDEVLRQTTLLVSSNRSEDGIEDNAATAGVVLTYEVEFNGVTIDPMTMIEVNG